MQIRKAVKEDASMLNHLLTLLIQDEKQYDENIDENFVVTNMYENYIEDPKKCILVATIEEQIVGYLYGFIKDMDATLLKQEAQLDALYIKEEYRGKKFADALIEKFICWLKENHITSVTVGVCSLNTKAKQLYQKHHFVPLKEKLQLKIN